MTVLFEVIGKQFCFKLVETLPFDIIFETDLFEVIGSTFLGFLNQFFLRMIVALLFDIIIGTHLFEVICNQYF